MGSRVSIDARRCKGCNLCVHACRRGVLAESTPHGREYPIVAVVAPEACTGCALCALMCPDVAIAISR
ncbi:MAG: 4Fe-4S binding protein [Firmicutes bacterium]|nr:4Fe-4S binding protein [Bacillota bacterium]